LALTFTPTTFAMTPLFQKLNFAEGWPLHVLNTPASFEPELRALVGTEVNRHVRGKIVFALAFVKTTKELEEATEILVGAAEGDAQLWMVYPKGSSKRYNCDFNRDTGWQALGQAGFEPVRQVAIDEDWSALRFRRAEFIKTLSRKREAAISSAGRKRALEQKPRAV
jgi:hypothetical protein